jgi:hypothetical protein
VDAALQLTSVVERRRARVRLVKFFSIGCYGYHFAGTRERLVCWCTLF